MNRFCFIILITVGWVLIACEKPEIQNESNDVRNLDSECQMEPVNISNLETKSRKINYKHPVFNPLNNNEILYVKEEEIVTNGFNRSLIYRNLETNEESIIKTGITGDYKADWSIEDWITYSSLSFVYKIHKNGTGDTNLLFNNISLEDDFSTNINPKWSVNGALILYLTDKDLNIFHLKLIDNEGHLVKSFYELTNVKAHDFSPNSENIAYIKDKGLYTYHINTGISRFVASSSTSDDYYLEWIDDSNILWSNNYELYKTNVSSRKTELFKSNCFNMRFSSPSISGDGTKIIAHVEENKLNNEGYIYSETNIVIMDSDGGNIEMITSN